MLLAYDLVVLVAGEAPMLNAAACAEWGWAENPYCRRVRISDNGFLISSSVSESNSPPRAARSPGGAVSVEK
jgi:hypothetical protein